MSQLQLILLLNWFIEVGTYMVKTISIPDLAVTGIYNVAFHKRYPSGAKRQAYRLNAPDRLCGSRYCARNGYPVRFKSWSVSSTLSQVILAAALFMVRPIMAASASICSRLFLFTVTYHELRMTRLVIAKRMGEVVIAASCCAYVPLVRNRPTGMNT